MMMDTEIQMTRISMCCGFQPTHRPCTEDDPDGGRLTWSPPDKLVCETCRKTWRVATLPT